MLETFDLKRRLQPFVSRPYLMTAFAVGGVLAFAITPSIERGMTRALINPPPVARPKHQGRGKPVMRYRAGLGGAANILRPRWGRMAYLVPARGDIIVNGSPILTREGAAVRDEKHLEIEAQNDSEILLIDAA